MLKVILLSFLVIQSSVSYADEDGFVVGPQIRAEKKILQSYFKGFCENAGTKIEDQTRYLNEWIVALLRFKSRAYVSDQEHACSLIIEESKREIGAVCFVPTLAAGPNNLLPIPDLMLSLQTELLNTNRFSGTDHFLLMDGRRIDYPEFALETYRNPRLCDLIHISSDSLQYTSSLDGQSTLLQPIDGLIQRSIGFRFLQDQPLPKKCLLRKLEEQEADSKHLVQVRDGNPYHVKLVRGRVEVAASNELLGYCQSLVVGEILDFESVFELHTEFPLITEVIPEDGLYRLISPNKLVHLDSELTEELVLVLNFRFK